ncbi:CDF family Co(II)/Ni(II) efflux transporter DmeF [bacterium]|nr:CDF family Co(II)/Ni(II) efflux transporter DmeF [bacterium]
MSQEISRKLEAWRHDHVFGQDRPQRGESRTRLVIAITAVTMIVEIAAGLAFGSMALLADGMHMASHAAALSINAFAYYYARRCAHDSRFTFGAGKVNALGGFSGALLLAIFAVLMTWESIERFLNPVAIGYNQAIFVAIVGLVINAVSVIILGGHHDHDQSEAHRHGNHGDHHHHHDHDHHHDHNLQSAYLHVLADALTSILAIFALLAGKYFGLNWLDPAMGILGAFLVARWSFGLLRTTARVLLDRQGPSNIIRGITDALESGEGRITDLHVWSIGPSIYAAIISIVSIAPKSANDYKSHLPRDVGLVHVTVEVHEYCPVEANKDLLVYR